MINDISYKYKGKKYEIYELKIITGSNDIMYIKAQNTFYCQSSLLKQVHVYLITQRACNINFMRKVAPVIWRLYHTLPQVHMDIIIWYDIKSVYLIQHT